MPELPTRRCFHFGAFEANAETGELRKLGTRIRLAAQPFQVLVRLVERPGELVTREELGRHLWPEGTFVDFEHGLNSCVNRVREALGDTANNPRFIETMARRGYRFIAPVTTTPDAVNSEAPQVAEVPVPDGLDGLLASPADLPKASHQTVQWLFAAFQAMYIGYYVGALANLAEIEELFAKLTHPTEWLAVLVVTATLLIPARAFALSAAVLHPPDARRKLLMLWRFLLPCDVLWSLAPFLLLHHFSFGLALACSAFLVYSPFAQRSLILMGAGTEKTVGFADAHVSKSRHGAP